MSPNSALTQDLCRAGQKAGVTLVLFLLVASCMSSSSVGPPPPGEAQRKFIEYQLAANVVSRDQMCSQTLLRELRAMMERSDGAQAEQEFVKKWGLRRFDPSTSFDDASAACVGEPTLRDLGMRDNETTISFLERKRREWERAEQAEK